MTPEDLQAREAIRHTISTYNTCGDDDDARGFADCFTQDGTFRYGDLTVEGREAIYEWKLNSTVFAKKPLGQAITSRVHYISNIHIELLSEDRARSRAPWFVLTNNGPYHAGIYHDTFRREGEKWLIETRDIEMLWKVEETTSASPKLADQDR